MFLLISFGGGLDQPLGRVAHALDCLYSKIHAAGHTTSRANGSAMVGVFWGVCVSLCHSSSYVDREMC